MGLYLKIDVARVKRLLYEIEEAIKMLEKAVSMSEEDFLNDITTRYAVKYAIIKIVETSAVLGTHILESEYELIPESYGEVFDLLSKVGVLDNSTAMRMKKLVGLRNLLVHRYWVVDDSRIYREAKGRGLRVIKNFVEMVYAYVSGR